MNRIQMYGSDILSSPTYQSQRSFIQHGTVSVYSHCVNVAMMCLKIVTIFHLHVDERALVRGALLHDYFLYDWHEAGHSFHGFTHPAAALANARKDYEIGAIESDMIVKHMFPLTVTPPRYKESFIICLADKLVAIRETLHR